MKIAVSYHNNVNDPMKGEDMADNKKSIEINLLAEKISVCRNHTTK
jgi:hypothetical protein